MRHVSGLIGMGAVLLLAGCSSTSRWGSLGRQPQPSPTPPPVPTAAALVDYLNRTTGQLQSLEVMDLDLDVKQRLQAFGLRGQLVCQRPKNFRMSAKVMGSQEVDVGSNEKEFWYWIKRAEPPYQFYCSHEDFSRGHVQVALPFQPDWVMQALGMADFGPPERYQVVEQPQRIDLVERVRNPQGHWVKKVIGFSRNPNGVQVPLFQLTDDSGKEICSAHILEAQMDAATGCVYPRRLKLVWPAEKIELTLRLDEVTVNRPIPQERAAILFSRPNLQNVQPYNLARGRDTPTGNIRRTGGYFQR